MQPKTFIHQLHHMLNDKTLKTWIRWSTEDDNVFCLKPYDPEFPSKVLKKNFKHGNVSSFVRQLHMYGFHKLQSGPNGLHPQQLTAQSAGANAVPHPSSSASSSSDDPPTHIIKSNKESMVWYFTHPSGYFYKDACQLDLARIQRKSNGVGKDGKRKNGLSPVCVSILDPNVRSNTPSGVDLQRYSVPSSTNPTPPQRRASSLESLMHPVRQQPVLRPSMFSSAAPITQSSVEQTGAPGTAHQQPLPAQPIQSTQSVHITQPIQPSQPVQEALQPTLAPSAAPEASGDVMHYENNIQLLQRCILTIVDILQLPPSEQHSLPKLQQSLHQLKSEILSMDQNWLSIRQNFQHHSHPYYIASSTHSSLSSEASGPLNPPSSNTTTTGSIIGNHDSNTSSNTSRFSSLSSNQKNPSIFGSSSRLSSITNSTPHPLAPPPPQPTYYYHHTYHHDIKAPPVPVFPPLQQQAYAYSQYHAPPSQSQGSNILQ